MFASVKSCVTVPVALVLVATTSVNGEKVDNPVAVNEVNAPVDEIEVPIGVLLIPAPPPTFSVPPRYTLPAMPKPPGRATAPVDVLVEFVEFDTFNMSETVTFPVPAASITKSEPLVTVVTVDPIILNDPTAPPVIATGPLTFLVIV